MRFLLGNANERTLVYMMLVPRSNFDLFDDIFKDPFFGRNENKMMKTDIKERKHSYQIEIDLPGFNKDDIKIDVTDGYLTINAKTSNEKKDDHEEKYVRRERYFGECSRTFYVGDNVEAENIKASFKNGILILEVPKEKEQDKLPEKKYVKIND